MAVLDNSQMSFQDLLALLKQANPLQKPALPGTMDVGNVPFFALPGSSGQSSGTDELSRKLAEHRQKQMEMRFPEKMNKTMADPSQAVGQANSREQAMKLLEMLGGQMPEYM